MSVTIHEPIPSPEAAATMPIARLVEANPVVVLLEREKFDAFYAEIVRECDAHVPDISTDKGRKAISSLAYKVARTKTAIDDAGKRLNEEARRQINKVDESRREIREKLDALKDRVRKPLSEWEEAEAARVDRCARFMERLQLAAKVDITETAAGLRERLEAIRALTPSEADFGGTLDEAISLQGRTLETLNAAVERLEREERDRAELERLRAQEVERERAEAERRAKEEAERLAREQAEAAERKRLADEQAERERIAAAEAKAREDAERRAREETAARDRAHQAEIERVKREAEEKVRREAEQRAEAERARQAEEARIAREAEQRAKNVAHRSAIMGAAKAAIVTAGPVDEETARNIVRAIVAGEVPHTSIQF